MTEPYPLYNREEVIEKVLAFGGTLPLATRVFNSAAKSTLPAVHFGPRTSHDLCYEETTRSGELETVIAVHAIWDNLGRLEREPYIGTQSIAMYIKLVKSVMEPDTAMAAVTQA